MHFFQRNRTLFPLFELLVILEPIHRAGSGSSSCLLRDIEFPTDPNARPESSYPLVLIRSTREEILHEDVTPVRIVSATRPPPIHRLLRSTVPSFSPTTIGGERGERGKKEETESGKDGEGATTPREISVFFASSRSSMFAYGDGSNRYSMNSKNLLLAEGTPVPFFPFPAWVSFQGMKKRILFQTPPEGNR